MIFSKVWSNRIGKNITSIECSICLCCVHYYQYTHAQTYRVNGQVTSLTSFSFIPFLSFPSTHSYNESKCCKMIIIFYFKGKKRIFTLIKIAPGSTVLLLADTACLCKGWQDIFCFKKYTFFL